jgi:large repetitive protein
MGTARKPSKPPGCRSRRSPNATITRRPRDKTKKKTARFEFSGTDTRAVAGFQCSLDGGAFATCTSPQTVKVKKGRHTFEVRAVDQAGNVGAAASDSWKRKKK